MKTTILNRLNLSALSLLLIGAAFTATSCANDLRANRPTTLSADYTAETVEAANCTDTTLEPATEQAPEIVQNETVTAHETTSSARHQDNCLRTKPISECFNPYDVSLDFLGNGVIIYINCDDNQYGPYEYYNYAQNYTRQFLSLIFACMNNEERASLYTSEDGYITFRLVGQNCQRYLDYNITTNDLRRLL